MLCSLYFQMLSHIDIKCVLKNRPFFEIDYMELWVIWIHISFIWCNFLMSHGAESLKIKQAFVPFSETTFKSGIVCQTLYFIWLQILMKLMNRNLLRKMLKIVFASTSEKSESSKKKTNDITGLQWEIARTSENVC